MSKISFVLRTYLACKRNTDCLRHQFYPTTHTPHTMTTLCSLCVSSKLRTTCILTCQLRSIQSRDSSWYLGTFHLFGGNLDYPDSLGPNKTVWISYSPEKRGRFIHSGIGMAVWDLCPCSDNRKVRLIKVRIIEVVLY